MSRSACPSSVVACGAIPDARASVIARRARFSVESGSITPSGKSTSSDASANGVSPSRPSFSRSASAVDRAGAGLLDGRLALDGHARSALGGRLEDRQLADRASDAHVQLDAMRRALRRHGLLLAGGIARLPHPRAGPIGALYAAIRAEPHADLAIGGCELDVDPSVEDPPYPPADLGAALDQEPVAARDRRRRSVARRTACRGSCAGPETRPPGVPGDCTCGRRPDAGGRPPRGSRGRSRACTSGGRCRAPPRSVRRAPRGRRRPRRYRVVVAATYSGPFRRPSILRETTPSRASSGTRALASRSSGERRYARSPSSRTTSVDHELVGQPARLRASAAVGAASADGLAREALPRVRDAERAVDEDLELDVRRAGDGRDVLERQLAREDDAIGPAIAREKHARGVGARHLRRRVDSHARRDGSHELRGTEVLNDDGIDCGGRTRAHLLLEARELRVEHQGVQRDVPADASAVQRIASSPGDRSGRSSSPGRARSCRRARSRPRPPPPGRQRASSPRRPRGQAPLANAANASFRRVGLAHRRAVRLVSWWVREVRTCGGLLFWQA